MDLNIALKYARRLAKTHEYQTIFNGAKEYGFKIFENNRDFSAIQFHFLGFLNFYATISMDIYLNEIDERVFNNEIYEDAYMFYKEKERIRKKNKEDKSENINYSKSNNPIEKVSRVKSQWKFRGSK